MALILGAATVPSLIAAAFMNLNFLLAGTVSTNPILYTAAILLLAAGTAAHFYGVDRFAIRVLKEKMEQRRKVKDHSMNNKHVTTH
jgi:thiosulfate dehydrogenase [quinone] large subunit